VRAKPFSRRRNQQSRINSGVNSGQLTPGETRNLENRDANGTLLGVDLNLRAAWPVTRGAGTVIAVADDGVELTHP